MVVKAFINAVMRVLCQIVRQARRTIYRVLSWKPYVSGYFRLREVVRC
jgi:hypothetical protein